ncbi:cupin domain-containing protein [Streptomyces sp. NPDC051219]|uniref:JmjC domain-containing protein n=1 Tax=Streptomyces sp. NPDC051219 TaxID=3155283 RepID=UPI003422AD82
MDVLRTDAEGLAPPAGLGDLLYPLRESDFLGSRLGTAPVVVEGPEGRFAGVFGWDQLNDILAAARVDLNRIHLVRAAENGSLMSCAEPVPQLAPRGRPLRIRPDHLHDALSLGATLVIDGIEELHAPLRTLVTGVENSLRSLVQANLYANLGGAEQGFDTHWDDHDVLIMQVGGAKRWDIHPPTQDAPVGVLSRPPRPSAESVCWSGELTDGDVLYLPRGWWHTVRAVDGQPSVHLTLGTRLPSAADLLRQLLVHLAVEDAVVRQDLPRFAGDESAAQWYGRLRRVLTDAVHEPGLLEKLAADLDGGAPVRPRFGLPHRSRERDATP